MVDSDDEYDRKRRDKFRGERTESIRGGDNRRDDRRIRDEWNDRYVDLIHIKFIIHNNFYTNKKLKIKNALNYIYLVTYLLNRLSIEVYS